MLVEVRHTFHLPEGNGIDVLVYADSESSIEIKSPNEDMKVCVAVPSKSDDPGWHSRSEAEGWEVRSISSFEVRCMREITESPKDGDSFEVALDRAAEESLPSAARFADAFARNVRWRSGQFWLPDRLSDRYGSVTSFYSEEKNVSHDRARITIMTAGSDKLAVDDSKWKIITGDLTSSREAPLEERLLLDARLARSEEDYRVALIWAAVALEVALVKLLRKALKGVASESQIDKFLEEMSNRLLSTVVLGIFKIGEQSLRDRCRGVFEVRNAVVHGKRQSVSLNEATTAIDAAQAMIDQLSTE